MRRLLQPGPPGEVIHFVQDMDLADASIGAIVLGADRNWRASGWFKRVWVLLTGDRVVIDHLRMRSHIVWHRGRPFLTHVEGLDEVGGAE